MNETVIEPAKSEDYNDILELFIELHEVLIECNPKKYWKLEDKERENLFPKEIFDYCLDMEAKNTNALNFYKKLGMVESRIKFSMSSENC